MSIQNITLPHEKLQDLGIGLVYLFGSQVESASGPLSDVDIGIVCSDPATSQGNTVHLYNKLFDIFSAVFKTDNIDIVFLHRAPLELKFDVVTHGRVLFAISKDFQDQFEHHTIMLYADFKPTLDQFDQAVLSRL